MSEYIYIETYGCSANLNNSEIISGLVKQAGLEITNNPSIADIVIINSCIVKAPTENKIKERIQYFKELKKPIIITGCCPNIKDVYFLSNKNIKQVNNLIKSIIEEKDTEKFAERKDEIKLNLPKISKNKFIGITQISEGCLGNCTYCITRIAKGTLFSYPQDEIIKNIQSDVNSGCKEVWITSQDNASYGQDRKKYLLPQLLNEVTKIKGNFKIRIGMMNPNNVLPILDDLIEVYKNDKVYKFLHIPLQSASDEILNKMNRHYKLKDFLTIVNKFKKEIPNITIATDIIVAFPGETEKDFNETLKLIEKIQPEMLNVSKYWIRQGTEAAKLKQVDKSIAKERAEKLMKLYSSYMKKKNESFIGKVISVFPIDNISARTENYKLVECKSKSKNVKIIGIAKNHLIGESF